MYILRVILMLGTSTQRLARMNFSNLKLGFDERDPSQMAAGSGCSGFRDNWVYWGYIGVI